MMIKRNVTIFSVCLALCLSSVHIYSSEPFSEEWQEDEQSIAPVKKVEASQPSTAKKIVKGFLWVVAGAATAWLANSSYRFVRERLDWKSSFLRIFEGNKVKYMRSLISREVLEVEHLDRPNIKRYLGDKNVQKLKEEFKEKDKSGSEQDDDEGDDE